MGVAGGSKCRREQHDHRIGFRGQSKLGVNSTLLVEPFVTDSCKFGGERATRMELAQERMLSAGGKTNFVVRVKPWDEAEVRRADC